ncbi:MAG: flagellar export chaperone FlgN [Phycisphaerales bacterium]
MTGASEQRTAGDEARAIARLIDEQVGLYEELDQLSAHQHAIIEDDDTDAILRVLSDRDAVIGRIRDVSSRLAPYQARWSEHIALLPDAERDRLRARLSSVEAMMERISSRDESDRLAMQRRRETLGGQLSGVNRSGQAMSAYTKAHAKGPRFQDREA